MRPSLPLILALVGLGAGSVLEERQTPACAGGSGGSASPAAANAAAVLNSLGVAQKKRICNVLQPSHPGTATKSITKTK